MNDIISQKDIQQLAKVSCDVVNHVDFPESGNLERSCQQMRKLLSSMLSRSRDSELLFDAFTAVSKQPMSKIELYTVTRDIVKLARETPESQPMVPASLLAARTSQFAAPAHVS